jgi:hypothetical protein
MKLHAQLRINIVNQLKQINNIDDLVLYRNEIWKLLADRQLEIENTQK